MLTLISLAGNADLQWILKPLPPPPPQPPPHQPPPPSASQPPDSRNSPRNHELIVRACGGPGTESSPVFS